MATNIGTLAASITLSSAAFTAGAKSVETRAKSMVATVTGVLAAIAIPVTAAGLFSAWKDEAAKIKEVGNASKAFGVTTEEMAGLVSLAGGNIEELIGGVSRLRRELGEVRTGSETAAAKFRVLGLNSEALAKSSLPQALGMIGDQLKKFPNQFERGLAAYGIFGKGFATLLPVLDKGSAGIAVAMERVKKNGLAFSEADFQKIKDADRAIKNVEETIAGLRRQLAIEGAPFIEGLANAVKTLIEGVDLKKTFVDGFKFAVKVVDGMIQSVIILIQTIEDLRKAMPEDMGGTPKAAGIQWMKDNWLTGKDAKAEETIRKKLAEELKKPQYLKMSPMVAESEALRNITGGSGGAASGLQKLLDKARQAQEELYAALDKKTPKKTPQEELNLKTQQNIEYIGELTKHLYEEAGAMKLAQKEHIDLAQAAELLKEKTMGIPANVTANVTAIYKYNNALKEASKYSEAALSPVQRFWKEFDRLKFSLVNQILTWDEYAAGIAAAKGQLESFVGTGQAKLPELATAGSREAFDVLTRSEAGNDPKRDMVDLLKQANTKHDAANRDLYKIVKNTEGLRGTDLKK